MKNRTNKLLRRKLPHQPGGRALTLVDGQFQGPPLEPETALADAACLTKELKHLLDGLLHPLIGIFDDLPAGVADITGRQEPDQFPATGFGLHPLLHPLMQHFELRHTHRRLDAQHQLGIKCTDIVDIVGIRDQRVEQRA